MLTILLGLALWPARYTAPRGCPTAVAAGGPKPTDRWDRAFSSRRGFDDRRRERDRSRNQHAQPRSRALMPATAAGWL
jgi:hypothetical protein